MKQKIRRTKIVATLGPASNSPEMIRALIHAGMDVARLNFSHGNYEDHAKMIASLRSVSEELGKPTTILQDLQGPKIRVGQLQEEGIELTRGTEVRLVHLKEYQGSPGQIPVDYPGLTEEVQPGNQVLLDDGLLELRVKSAGTGKVICEVLEGGLLKSRKGVNFPQLNLRLPSLTEKDKEDLAFGLGHGVDWISLSFVRSAEDILILKKFIGDRGYRKPVIAKIEKPQAIDHLKEILAEVNGIMVARGDLGVELSPEKVPMIQKHIIEQCNRLGLPVITATQMLESMIHEPRPTRAEASDVANAIVDGTDCIMLSGETAVGAFPVKAVEMMDRIAREVEQKIDFRSYPPSDMENIMALSEAVKVMEKVVETDAVVVLTTSGRSARYMAAERPGAPVYALTDDHDVYHALNLLWGIRPVLVTEFAPGFDELINLSEKTLLGKKLVEKGNRILVLGGVPAGIPGGTNFIKIHTIT